MEKLSDGEWRLMELLWEASPINSTQLVALCRERLDWSKSTTYTVLRRLVHKGAAENEAATVTPKITREEALRAQEAELTRQAGGFFPLITAFFSGKQITPQEAEELKRLIDQHTWEG